MNPLWFYVGLEIGERLRASDAPRRLLTEVSGFYGRVRDRYRALAEYEDFLSSLPTTETRG